MGYFSTAARVRFEPPHRLVLDSPAAFQAARREELMNLAHVHIILNHIPSLGSIACLCFLAAAIYTKNDTLKKYTLVALVLIALTVLPTYVTGTEALRIVRNQPAMSRPMVEIHQNAAMVTLLMMTITGTLAWFGLWELRRFSHTGTVTSVGTLLSTALTVAAILYTASLGGKISHPEVREAADAGVTMSAGWREPIEILVGSRAWIWPSLETLHFVGMTLLFGVSLLLMLRMLGLMKSVPFSGIHRLLPMGVIAFIVNLLTGMIFFIAGPGNYVAKTGFHIKIASIVVAGLPLLYFTMLDEPWHTGSNQNASVTSKFAAVLMFGLLIVVVVYGRFLPFLFQGQ
jgi:hypothetical protein